MYGNRWFFQIEGKCYSLPVCLLTSIYIRPFQIEYSNSVMKARFGFI